MARGIRAPPVRRMFEDKRATEAVLRRKGRAGPALECLIPIAFPLFSLVRLTLFGGFGMGIREPYYDGNSVFDRKGLFVKAKPALQEHWL